MTYAPSLFMQPRNAREQADQVNLIVDVLNLTKADLGRAYNIHKSDWYKICAGERRLPERTVPTHNSLMRIVFNILNERGDI